VDRAPKNILLHFLPFGDVEQGLSPSKREVVGSIPTSFMRLPKRHANAIEIKRSLFQKMMPCGVIGNTHDFADAIALRFPSGDTSRFVSPPETLRERLQRALHQEGSCILGSIPSEAVRDLNSSKSSCALIV
jgi:hypothetical protein